MRYFLYLMIFSGIMSLVFVSGCQKDPVVNTGSLQLTGIKANNVTLNLQGQNPGIPVDCSLFIEFTAGVDTASARSNISLATDQGSPATCSYSFSTDQKTITLIPLDPLDYYANYIIDIKNTLKGAAGETFPGLEVTFTTGPGVFSLESMTLNGQNFLNTAFPKDIDYQSIKIEMALSAPLDPSDHETYITLSDNTPLTITLSQDQKHATAVNDEDLEDYIKTTFRISSNLVAENGYTFGGYSNSFYTSLDSSYKFPPISDDELLNKIEQQTFKYFYDFAHPASGMTRERNTSGDVVTSGGSGFGVMALIVGMERNFISRQQGLDQLDKTLGFLETCDRFHGAWPHWLNGSSGAVVPFTTKDDGADLVETSYMIQGLMTMRQYLQPAVPEEEQLIDRINALIDSVEWDWFTRSQNVLYWHWSPYYGWDMNMRIQGYNETLIAYIMAAASTTHTIAPEVYHQGYARNGGIVNGSTYLGYVLPLGSPYGGPLFFTHYSHLGLDPRNLQDNYASYWQQGVNMSLINWAHCVDNPKGWVGYSNVSWGLTASDNPWGYNAHSPTNDLGVITPTAAVSALPYTPDQSMDAIRQFYFILGDKLWGEYGFYDAFDVTEGWWANSYLAIDQGPIVCMVENYRTGLLWDLFMSAPEVQQGLDKLGFTY